MVKKDSRVDAYIAKAAPFARPILKHLRKRVHAVCNEVAETLKWRAPFFLYRGRILCGMAAFKSHCAFFFWHKDLRKKSGPGMGQLGKITNLADLPADMTLASMIRRAMRLNEQPKSASAKPQTKKKLVVPAYFMSAIRKNKQAMETFKNFSHGKRKDYVEWVVEAKTEATRAKRLATTVEWLSEGKTRNWKYMKKRSAS